MLASSGVNPLALDINLDPAPRSSPVTPRPISEPILAPFTIPLVKDFPAFPAAPTPAISKAPEA